MVSFHYFLELFGRHGQSTGRVRVNTIDWLPAEEYVRFEAIRHGLLDTTASPPVSLEPVWDKQAGPPYVSGLLPILWPSDRRFSSEVPVPLSYFRQAAREASTQCVTAGTLTEGEVFTFRVTAFPVEPPRHSTPAANALDVEEIAEPLRIGQTAIRSFQEQSACIGPEKPGALAVFLPASVLAEAKELVRHAGDIETGGLLLGHLHRDTGDPRRIFVQITFQIPAAHTEANATRLTFTPQTWGAARAALNLRRSTEQILGWWHSHPNWCRACPAEKKATCTLSSIFFSTTDCALHRTVFPKAFQVALLLSDRDAGIIPSVFGWHRGLVTNLPFGLLGDSTVVVGGEFAATATVGGDEHHG